MSRIARAVRYSTAMETPSDNAAAKPSAGAAFLSRYEPFRGLDPEERERIAAAMTTRRVAKGEVVLVEGGEVGDELYVVAKGMFDLEHQGVTIGVLGRGKMFGHPTLITGEPPEFTTRAREDSTVYCIPPGIGLEVLGRPAGVRFVARGLRARLIDAARTMRALPDVRTRTVASLVHRPPVFCDPETTHRRCRRTDGGGAHHCAACAGRGWTRHRHRRRPARQGGGAAGRLSRAR